MPNAFDAAMSGDVSPGMGGGGQPAWGNQQPPVQKDPPAPPFVRPPLKNLGDILGFQQAALLEAIFHQHSQDANMKALRSALGIEGFYENDPDRAHTVFGPVVDNFLNGVQDKLTQLGRGTIDTLLQTATDPLTAETLGAGPIASHVLGPLGEHVLAPAGRAAGSLATRLLPKIAQDALREGRTTANALGQAWHHVTQYAADAKRVHGVPRVQQSIAAQSRMARRTDELNRRFQTIYTRSTQGLSKAQLSRVQQAMNGQIPARSLDPAERHAYEVQRGLTRVAGPVMQAHPGSGSVAAVSKFKPVGPKGAVKGTIKVAPKLDRLSVPQLRRQLFSTLKKRGLTGADRQAAIQKVIGKKTLAGASQDDLVRLMQHFDVPVQAETRGSRLLNVGYSAEAAKTTPISAAEPFADWINRLRYETAETMKLHGKPPQMAQDLGSPILKQPQYVKGPFGKLQRAPNVAAKRTLTGKAFEMQPPEMPPELQDFSGTPGEFTAANVRAQYHPGKHYRDVLSPNQPERTFNPLESHNPHLKTQAPMHIRPSQVDDFEQAFRGMLTTTARHITANEFKVKLGHIWGIKPEEVEKSLPREVFDLFTHKKPATGSERDWKQVLADTWKGLVNLPKAAIVGASPFHMVNIGDMMARRDPGAFLDSLRNFGKTLAAGNDPAARWSMLHKEAADYGLGTPLEDARSWTTRVPLMRYMNRLTWDWDTSAALAMAKRIEKREGLPPLEAGQKAREQLVDYDHASAAQQAAKYVAPFAQYTTAIPGIVLRGLTNPKTALRTELINRATGGKFLGGGDQDTGEYFGPTAKVGRMFNLDALLNPDQSGNRLPGATSFVRGSLAEPVKFAGGLMNRGFTYGKDPLSPAYLLQAGADELPLPYVRSALELTGFGPFQPHTLGQEATFTMTGYSPGKQTQQAMKQQPQPPTAGPAQAQAVQSTNFFDSQMP